ncbi:recombinase family protein [Bradyrhizobium manausense]|uniref:recombinase family protein n=1 Tax=Bradyrhizobium manausense TaxID=989370 RepID=UPI001BA919BE|nr:recombinase family protein [Bradyrhizobium manausense]MBR1092717.1 recombinase family protein [Bradyrhizobium manausense]
MSDDKKISAAPSWLGLSEDRRSYVFRPERAEVVRRIFELAIGGMGSYAIANYLDGKKVPTFTNSENWDHTTIDYMLRNRATYGEYQPKSFAGGHKKGVPNGPPIPNYYPAVIDRNTYETAQIARKQNLANRGRKGNELANIFGGLTRCAYCGNEFVLHRVTNIQVLACAQDLNGIGCSRTAWTYRDFEITLLAFLAHPALADRLQGRQKDKLIELIDRIVDLSTNQERSYPLRVDIAVLLKEIVTEIIVHSAGDISAPRLPSAQISKDVRGRYSEIRLWDGQLDRCLSLS